MASPSVRWGLAAAALSVAGAVGWGIVAGGDYATRQSAERSFVLDENFTVVRKILVRKDAAKQIVAMGGDSEFVEQNWTAVGGEIESLQILDPAWRLELHGQLTVRTLDDYVGREVIVLDQDVEITVDRVNSEVRLSRGAERLADYAMTTRFSRTPAETTQVELTLAQQIRTDAPWFAHRIADRRVLAAVERSLANQERAIRQLVADHRDDVPLLPLR